MWEAIGESCVGASYTLQNPELRSVIAVSQHLFCFHFSPSMSLVLAYVTLITIIIIILISQGGDEAQKG